LEEELVSVIRWSKHLVASHGDRRGGDLPGHRKLNFQLLPNAVHQQEREELAREREANQIIILRSK
jgi:hypothetical protein